MIEPVSDAFTTSIRPAWSAKNAMISSAMFPNVAFRTPPNCGPAMAPSRSVASPTTHASPRIDTAARTNTTVSSGSWTSSSNAIVARLSARVATSAIRVAIESGPRIGRPARAGAGAGAADIVGES